MRSIWTKTRHGIVIGHYFHINAFGAVEEDFIVGQITLFSYLLVTYYHCFLWIEIDSKNRSIFVCHRPQHNMRQLWATKKMDLTNNRPGSLTCQLDTCTLYRLWSLGFMLLGVGVSTFKILALTSGYFWLQLWRFGDNLFKDISVRTWPLL